jgi:hypothetical protein
MARKEELTTRRYNWSAAVKLDTSGTSAQTAAVLGCTEVLVFATEDTWITLSTNPTAAVNTAGNLLLLAGEKFHIQTNPSYKLAAIQDSAAGSVHIVPTTL